MGLKNLVKSGLEYSCDLQYEKLLCSKEKAYNSWISERETNFEHLDLHALNEQGEPLEEDFGIYRNSDFVCKYSNLSFRIVSMDVCAGGFNVRSYIEDIIIFVNGRLSQIAIPLIGLFFEKHPKAVVAYGDEDIMLESGERVEPFFKPEFSPNEFLDHFYFCNIVAIRRIAFREMDWTGELSGAASLYHNLLRLLYSDIKYIDYGVGHIEGVLLHAKDYKNEHITDASATKFVNGLIDNKLQAKKGIERKISVVICTKDHPDMLRKCLECFDKSSRDFDKEYIVVDNGSCAENKELNESIAMDIPFCYIYEPADFNYSKMCNRGAGQATGDVLLFLNDDVEITDAEVCESLWKQASYIFTGAAGIKLLYPDNNVIQHVGIVNSPFGPIHKLQGLTDVETHYHGFNRCTTNRIGVTGACLCIRRELYESLNGFDEAFPVAYNDVDLCFRLLEKGYYITCINSAGGIHRESVTRGADLSSDKAHRLLLDRERLYQLHPLIGHKDPFFNSYLLIEALDARVVPANEYSVDMACETAPSFDNADLTDARTDGCLKVAIEYVGQADDFITGESNDYLIQGYGVLTGSDNACYKKYLILDNRGLIMSVPMVGCIRKDVAHAFAEEKNVELSGFALRIPKNMIPNGEYRIGILMKREFSKEKIYNFTDKYLVIGEQF